jgi:rSAM/selenodomain-associated transferase 2
MPVSIIIPTLNEKHYLAGTVRRARALRPHEVIVVDGGSTDGTRESASDADLLLEGARGRARQMNVAARYATGDVFLFLHADCSLEPGALMEAERCLQQPGVVAGCFTQTIEARGCLYRAIDACATARVRLAGIAYGDQGLFVTKEQFERAGGFPEIGLMEDLFLCRKLRRLGRIVVAPKRIHVSPRRWRQVGIIRQTLRNWSLTALAAAGISPERLARLYPAVR